MFELRGRAMGSTLHIAVTGTIASEVEHLRALVQWAQDRVAQLEQRWSRFIDTSEVSLINAAAGTAVDVSPDTIRLVTTALEARQLSNGRFDPTLLQFMKANGYDRTFASIGTPKGLPPMELGACASRAIVVDEHARTVRVSAGAGFDPGGIGKGLAADMVAEELMDRGAAGAMVNIGGDVRCIGHGPADGTWVVAAGDATAGVENRLIGLTNGGIATSTCRRRTWTRRTDAGVVDEHHLLDPLTGSSSSHAADLVTVVAGRCADAEWIATAIAAQGHLPDDPTFIGAATVLLTDSQGNQSEHGQPERFLR